MDNLRLLYSSLAFATLLMLAPITLWGLAYIQKKAIQYIAMNFLGFELCGRVVMACIVGLIGGTIASTIVSAFGGELLALAVYLLASWPLLVLWTKKARPTSISLTHKEAAILSSSSSFVTLVLLFLIGYAISTLATFGFLAFF